MMHFSVVRRAATTAAKQLPNPSAGRYDKYFDMAHKVVGGSLIVFTAFGILNWGGMYAQIYRKAKKAEKLRQEEAAAAATNESASS
ncbi:hypothetical protein BJ742DRAFT_765547 [Cladochytrium replicatum]|nr:hypothetical protein BJ742DRAFT_765547 [Cladochytrium replicatum]